MRGEAQEQRPARRVVIFGDRFAYTMLVKREQIIHRLNDNVPVCSAITKRGDTRSPKWRVLRPGCGIRVDFDIPFLFKDYMRG